MRELTQFVTRREDVIQSLKIEQPGPHVFNQEPEEGSTDISDINAALKFWLVPANV
jgi:hypothetical protein